MAILIAGIPGSARAWTDAKVRSVHAHLSVRPDGSLDTELRVGLRVDGGWLEGFDLDGLSEELVLSSAPAPTFVDLAGQPYRFEIEHRGGRVTFAFRRRRDAPRRGDYLASVAFRAPAASEPVDEHVRVRWTMPAWRYGLDDVAVIVDAPAGSRAVLDPEDSGVTSTSASSDSGARIELRRVHLPRTRSWTIAIDVPAHAMIPELRAAHAEPPPQPAQIERSESDRASLPWWLPLVIGLLALVRSIVIARAEHDARICALPRWGEIMGPRVERTLRLLAIATLTGLSIAAGPGSELSWLALAGAVAAALIAVPTAARAPRLGAFRPALASELRAARWAHLDRTFGARALLDGDSIAGRSCLLALIGGMAYAAVSGALAGSPAELSLCGALALALFRGRIVSIRARSPKDDLHDLAALARAIRLDPDRAWELAFQLAVHRDARGQAQEARLRVVLPSMPKGLLRFDVVCMGAAELACLVVAREGSPADRALATVAPEITRGPRRVARVVTIARRDPMAGIAPVLEALGACPIEPRASVATEQLRATG